MSKNILLIAREERLGPDIQASINEVLTTSAADVPVQIATNALEAFRQAEQCQPDLVISDLVLSRPGLSGAGLCERLSELYPQCRTLLVTDHGAVSHLVAPSVDAVLERGLGDGVLEAPDLAEMLNRLLRLNTGDLTPTMDGAPFVPASPGRLLADKYRLVEIVGEGGMGTVYRAYDTFIRRPVAVKVLALPDEETSTRLARRMHREVRIAGALAHPHIVTLHDAGVTEEQLFLVMELIEGETLASILKREGALGRERSVELAIQILDALEHAHEKGVVHRDLKPANVLVTPDGVVKVADFGVAKLISMAGNEPSSPPGFSGPGDSGAITQEGAIIGTLSYMAPEQLISAELDHRADLYTVGILLFEMLSGEPFANHIAPLARAAPLTIGRDLKPLPDLPGEPALSVVVRRALEPHRSDRYRDSAAFRKAILEAVGASDRETGGWRRLLRWS